MATRQHKLAAGHPHHCPQHDGDFIHRDPTCHRKRDLICDQYWEAQPADQALPDAPPARPLSIGELMGLKPEPRLTPEEQEAYR